MGVWIGLKILEIIVTVLLKLNIFITCQSTFLLSGQQNNCTGMLIAELPIIEKKSEKKKNPTSLTVIK